MVRTGIVLAGVLLIAGIVAVVWSRTDRDAPAPAAAPARVSRAASVPAEPGEADTPVAPVLATASDPIPTTPFVDPASRPAAAPPAPRSDEPGVKLRDLVVQVVAAADGKPVPGAGVRHRALSEAALRTATGIESLDADSHAPEPGQPADERGEVRLSVPVDAWVTVDARADGLFGYAFAAPGMTAPLKVELRPEVVIPVLVTHAGGAPAEGVPVRLLGRYPDDSWFERAHTKSDRDGRAWIAGLALLPDDPVEAWKVATGVPAAGATEAGVSLSPPPQEPVQLVLPATGRLVVLLVGADGLPLGGTALVTVRTPGDEARPAPDDARRAALRVLAKNGRAEVQPVGTGQEFEVQVDPTDPALGRVTRRVAGPPSAGSEATVEIACGGLRVRLAGRIVETGGRPFAEAALRARLLDRHAAGMSSIGAARLEAVTDVEGRFVLALDGEASGIDAAKIGITLLREQPAGMITSHAGAEMEVPLPQPLRPGINDLGDVLMPARQVIVAGTVVDTRGAPVAGAEVFLKHKRFGDWSRDYDSGTASRDDGSFEIDGPPPEEEVAVSASKTGCYCSTPVRIKAGARGVLVRLDEAGGLEGSLAPAQEGVSVFLSGDAARTDELYWEEWSKRAQLYAHEGRFSASSLQPGTCDVAFHLDRNGEPTLVVTGVVIRAGQINRDPRLQGVDLSALVASFAVKVRDEAGGSIAGAEVSARPRGKDGAWVESKSGDDGVARVLCAAPLADVVVTKEGRRSARRVRESGDLEVVLRPADAVTVTVILEDGVAIPEPPFAIEAQLTWVRGLEEPAAADPEASHFHPLTSQVDHVPFGAERRAVLRTRDPGVYRIHLWITESRIDGGSGSGLDSESAEFTVAEDAKSVEVRVRADAEDLEHSIRRSRNR